MPTTADKAGGGRNEMVSPYQCAPQGKHIARLACGLSTKPFDCCDFQDYSKSALLKGA
jgi:hypothetical protein